MSNSNDKIGSFYKNPLKYNFTDCTDDIFERVLNPPKSKVTPWKPTVNQKTILEAIYYFSEKPSISLRDEIANQLNVPKKSIRIWFMNRAAKKIKQMEPTNIEKAVRTDSHLLEWIERFLLKFNKRDKDIKGYLANNVSLTPPPLTSREHLYTFHEIFTHRNDYTDEDLFFN